jgi:voltage-gated potassium channel
MFGAAVVLVVLVGALLAYAFERGAVDSNIQSFPDAIWWAIVTATTVGYGDLSPVTVEGRAIAVVLMLVGIGLLGVITANVAAFFVHNDESEQTHELNNKLARMEDLLAELTAELKRNKDISVEINPETLG